MKTILENTAQIFRADWGPTMKASTRVLALAVAIPAAIVWVVAQWLLFTYRKPLEGVLALVPVRKPEMAYSSARLAMASQVVASRIIDPVVSPTIENRVGGRPVAAVHLSQTPGGGAGVGAGAQAGPIDSINESMASTTKPPGLAPRPQWKGSSSAPS